MNSFKPILGAVLVAVLAGCGGLDSPDLNTGQVSGRLTGSFKKGDAFAYAFGAPGTKVLIRDDGSFTIDHVPVASNGNVPAGQTQVVVFDGETNIGMNVAFVKPASHTQADPVDASALVRARTVLTAARCSGGASASNTVYSVDGAALKDDAKGDVASLFPLPPGVFNVRAKLSGFKEKVQSVDLTPDADQQIELDLELDDSDAKKGCIANGCTDGRECDDQDGVCYGCTTDAQCGAGQKCDNRVCVLNGLPKPACTSCALDADCEAPGGFSGKCILDASGTGNICSNTCGTDANCPSGFQCNGGVCAPPSTCSAYFQEFGKVCFAQNPLCALFDAVCFGASGSTPGYCTSRCGSKSDCPESLGYKCNAQNVCAK